MADKILQTRIINKHADLATWKTSSLPLKTGEIALARVETTKPDGHGGHYTVPTYLMKVGDGEKTFSQLEWLAAPASDVYEWAKAQTKPGYTATEITRGSSTVAEDLTKAEQAIRTLETAVGTGGTVAQAITAAIEALDVEDTAVANQFVTAVAEADGKISVTRRALTADDIPTLEIAKITGLQSALDAKATNTALTEAVQGINTTIGTAEDAAGTATVYGAIATAKKAGDDAQDYAEGVNTALDTYKGTNDAEVAAVRAIAEAATTAEEAGTIAQGKVDTLANGQVKTNKEAIAANNAAITALAGEGRTTETVKANADAIAKLAEDIGNVANVMNFRGVSTGTNPGDGIDNPQNGDVIIFGDAEYVYNVVDGVGSWVKFGDASDNSTAISALQGRVTNLENDLKAGGATYQSITAAKAQADKGVEDAAAAQAKADANEDAIEIINGTGDGSITKAVEDAKTELKGYADTAESDAVATAKGYTDTEVGKEKTAREQAISALEGTVNANATTAANATKAVADDLADYKTTNDAAVEAAAAKGQQGIDDAAAALQYAKDLEAGQVTTNKQASATNAAAINTIKDTYARVDGDKLVYGQDEDVMTIIFDCGGAE